MENIPLVPVSIGELFDKNSILEIKLDMIKDEEKLNQVKNELKHLKGNIDRFPIPKELYEKLMSVNRKLWIIEDRLRIKEKNNEFDDEFIELARSVYYTNDERGDTKKEINTYFGSDINEVKDYCDYKK